MSRIISTVGRVVGTALAGQAGKNARKASANPVVGAAVGAASLFVAGKLLPRKLAGLGAALAAGYVTRKLAQRAERLATGTAPDASPPPRAPRRRKRQPAGKASSR